MASVVRHPRLWPRLRRLHFLPKPFAKTIGTEMTRIIRQASPFGATLFIHNMHDVVLPADVHYCPAGGEVGSCIFSTDHIPDSDIDRLLPLLTVFPFENFDGDLIA